MSKYHVNQDSGKVGVCSAKIKCEFEGSAEHFDTKQEAESNAEIVLSNKYGNLTKPARKIIRVSSVEVNEDFPHPQANRLDKVSTTVDAILNGANTAGSISQALDVVDRQGYYYGDAAGYLGLVDASQTGDFKEYSLTTRGQIFAESSPTEREAMLREITNSMPLMQILRDEGPDAAEQFIQDTQDTNETTAKRRVATLVTWDNALSSDMASEIESDRLGSSERFLDAATYAQEQRDKRNAPIKTEARGSVCQKCFMETSLTGACENCD